MTPDRKLDALGLVPRRVPTEALLAEAEREHAAELARARAVWPCASRPGTADTRAPDPEPASLALALVFGAAVAVIAAAGVVFVAGAACHALLGWPGVAASMGVAACGAAWAMRPRGST